MEAIQAMKYWIILSCFIERINSQKSKVLLGKLLKQGNFEKIHVVS